MYIKPRGYFMMIGQRFGRLEIISQIPKVVLVGKAKKKRNYWLCRCDCGGEKYIKGSALNGGRTRSCGCFQKECRHNASGKTKYGLGIKREPEIKRTYSSWAQMKSRCTNSKHTKFECWGGRGISVCERWLSFENFLADMGVRPEGMSIERIDNNKNYEQGNCCWATDKTQARNQRRTVFVNEEKLVDMCERLGLDRSRVYGRLKMGWLLKDAIGKPIKRYKKRSTP